jgi:hippurate hydrolase
MASEDFACMLDVCPGAYFWIGADGETPSRPLHNAHYDFNDHLIGEGISLWTALAERLLPLR